MSLARTEFSGLGHYGVCTIIGSESTEELSKILSRILPEGAWRNPEFEEYHSLGYDDSLRQIESKNAGEMVLSWDPRKTSSIKSAGKITSIIHMLLLRPNEVLARDTGMNMEIHAGQSDDHWFVFANFSPKVWDVIESERFNEILPAINSDIERWWDDQTGRKHTSKYVTVFDGRDGPTLQVYQPDGSGLWVSGSRKINDGYQIHDHNTDTGFQAMSHVIALCTILKHVRTLEK